MSPSASEYAAGALPFRFHDEAYTEETSASLSESPVLPVNLDAVKALFQQHFPHEPWPLAEEDEALLPKKSSNFVPGALQGTPDDFADAQPGPRRRLNYTQTIYGPRQSTLMGMRVSGTRRSGVGSVATYTHGASLNTETPNAGAHGYLSRTIQLQDASARLGTQADSAETMVNPAASSLSTTMTRLSPGVMHSMQSPLRPLQGAAEESDLASSVDSDAKAGLAATLASVHISPSELHSVPGLFPAESSQSSAMLDSEPSRPPSSLSSTSDGTAASDSLRPYLPGSFIVPPEEERELFGSKRIARARRKSRVAGPAGADEAKGAARTDRRARAATTLMLALPGGAYLYQGEELGLPEVIVRRQPFPGPGLAIRILGPVTRSQVALLQKADKIYIEEIFKAGIYNQISQAFAVLLPVRAVGVQGDKRTYDQVICLRAAQTTDFMTATWYPFDHAVLSRISNRITNEVQGVNRVVLDVSSKPPATIEWL